MKTYRVLLCLIAWCWLLGALHSPFFGLVGCCGVRSALAAEAHSTIDAYGDRLPKGATRRFGTIHLRHPGGATCVSFSADSKTLFSAGWDREICQWDIATGRQVANIPTTEGTFSAIVSPDGARLASGGEGVVRMYDLKRQQVVWSRAVGKNHRIQGAEFSSDGIMLATDGDESSFQIWDADTGDLLLELGQWDILNGRIEHEFKIDGQLLTGQASMALSTDKSLFVTSHRRKIVVWDTAKRQAVKTIAQPEHERRYYASWSHSVAISPNMQFVAERGIEYALRLWDLNTGAPVHLLDRTHDGAVLAIAPSPDGQLLATSGTEGAVHLWNNTSGEYVRQLHQGKGWARDVVFLPDGQHVAICGEFSDGKSPGYKGILEIVQVSDGMVRYQKTLEGRGMRVAISHDGQLLAVGIGLDFDGEHPPEIQVWDWAQDRQVAVLKEVNGEVKSLRFDDNSKTLWATTDRASLSWRFAEEKLADISKALSNSPEPVTLCVYDEQSRRSFVNRHIMILQWERRSNVFACVAGEQAPGQDVWSLPPTTAYANSVVLSPDRQMLAVSQKNIQDNSRVVILSAVDGAELRAFEVSHDSARSLAFSPDGKTLYSGMNRGDILAWDVSAISLKQK